MTTQDRPLIRASCSCPLCQAPKSTGLLVCWPCFRYFDLREFNEATEYSLDMAELALAGQADENYTRDKAMAEQYPHGYEWEERT